MLTDFYKPIIPYYSPVSAKGGKRRFTSKVRSRKYKRTNRRTRRRYH